MQAASAAQKSQRAQTVLAGSIPVSTRCVVGGTSPQALACDAPEAAGLPKGPDGNHGDNLKPITRFGYITSSSVFRRVIGSAHRDRDVLLRATARSLIGFGA